MKTVFGIAKKDFMQRVFIDNSASASGVGLLKAWEKYFDDHAADEVPAGACVANALDIGAEQYNPIPSRVGLNGVFVQWMQCPKCGRYGVCVDVEKPIDTLLSIRDGQEVYCECGFHGEIEGNGIDSWVKPVNKEAEPTKKETILSEELEKLRTENADLNRRINAAVARFHANDPIAAACELTKI